MLHPSLCRGWHLSQSCARLRSCREGGCRVGERKWWLGILFLGLMAPRFRTAGKGKGPSSTGEVSSASNQLSQAFWQGKFQEEKCHKSKLVGAGLGRGGTCMKSSATAAPQASSWHPPNPRSMGRWVKREG